MYLLPKPKFIREKVGNFILNHNVKIVISPTVGKYSLVYGQILQACIKKFTGYELSIIKGQSVPGDIFLTYQEECASQEYILDISPSGVNICGSEGAAVLYGVQTLCQIIEQKGGYLDCWEIRDKPDFLFRGYYLDETRGRVLHLEALKKLVDLLSRYKINEFQLYVEHTYLFRNLSEMWRDETPLTAEEIVELDEYCQCRHIDLIPSLASFGHLYTLLSTKTYCDMCEISDSERRTFSFIDRMQHHTINVADNRTLPLILAMLEEYMSLFSSQKFNICADETFDLGKGRSKDLADEIGLHRVYIEYVKALCDFVVSKGKQPMFWGDVICGNPELIKLLPENTICLNWGYAPDQNEEPTKNLATAGVKQYVCPGVAGWNQWMNLIENSYKNITRMCSLGQKYNAVGVLNTDWGDFGHINEPLYSIPGIIYGAAFSWNGEHSEFNEINYQISKLEYKDTTGQFVSLLASIPQYSTFQWDDAVIFFEKTQWNKVSVAMKEVQFSGDTNEKLESVRRELLKTLQGMDSSCRYIMQYLDVTIEGIKTWNLVGDTIKAWNNSWNRHDNALFELAERLENWFMAFKALWRKSSKEGDLHHISDIVFWYCNWLRGREIEDL